MSNSGESASEFSDDLESEMSDAPFVHDEDLDLNAEISAHQDPH